MDVFVSIVYKLMEEKYEDDFVDRMHYKYTPLIILLLGSVNIAKVYLGEAINCFQKAEFRPSWVQYSYSYCLIENTYFLRTNESIPLEHETRRERQIAYYQWVPYILILQALIFYLPQLIWRSSNWFTGLHIGNFVQTFLKDRFGERIDENAKKVAKAIDGVTDIRHKYFGIIDVNRYITILYFTMKIFNMIIVLINMFIYGQFIGEHLFGLSVIKHSGEWRNSGLFPRVTVCDFTINRIGQETNYTVECVLPLNMLNEKIFVLLWYWMLILLVANFINIINWIWGLSNRDKFYRTLQNFSDNKRKYQIYFSQLNKSDILLNGSDEFLHSEAERVITTTYNNWDLYVGFRLIKANLNIYTTSKIFDYWCDQQKPYEEQIENDRFYNYKK
ncbi:Innexin family-containing protein [Strongyloides ratti]|uniref:Innexin n=1 Tax=Strongyloides ratti TaxID=34506 RepID=A0A090MXZ2_STRRB|nr:Innexin family-containing protein [Strongyloides ratti]CEF66279.1 Innexin family-containing protein [Strongyloides ratti]